MVEEKVLYRYDSYWIEDQGPRIYVTAHKVIRETPKCYVIEDVFGRKKREMFVLKSHDGKRFAYNTLEAAYNGFLHRCRRRETITRSMWGRAKEVYEAAQDKEKLLSLSVRNNILY